MNKRYSIIAGGPRSGSTLLCTLCHNNGLGTPKEHFKTSEHNLPFSRAIALGESTEQFAREITANENGPIFATKIMWTWLETMVYNAEKNHCSPFQLIESIFPNAKYIFITRKDRLGQAISLLRAAATNEWIRVKNNNSEHNKQWPEKIEPAQIHQAVLALAMYDSYWQKFFVENGITPFEITYEELTADTEGIITRLGRFVEGDSFQLQSISSDLLIQRDEQSEQIRRDYLLHPLGN